MNDDHIPTRPEDAPGHYGAGYGEQVPEDAPPRPAPATDSEGENDGEQGADVASSAGPRPAAAAAGTGQPASIDDDDAPVVFTPADVSLRPPDTTPIDHAPESEKAGLLFERS